MISIVFRYYTSEQALYRLLRLFFKKSELTHSAAPPFQCIFFVNIVQKVPKPFWLRNFFCYLLCAIMESKHLDHNHGEADWKTRKEKDQ